MVSVTSGRKGRVGGGEGGEALQNAAFQYLVNP